MQCQSLLTPPSFGGHALASVSAFFSLLRLSYIDPCDPVKNPPRPFPNPNPHHRLHILTIRRYIAVGSPHLGPLPPGPSPDGSPPSDPGLIRWRPTRQTDCWIFRAPARLQSNAPRCWDQSAAEVPSAPCARPLA